GWFNIIPLFPENIGGFYSGYVHPTNGPFEITAVTKAAVMLLTVILLVESTVVFIIRRINMPVTKGIREPGLIRYIFLIGLIYLAHYLLMYVPLAQEILAPYGLHFFFIPLTMYDWFICILAALPAILGMELYKKRLRSKGVSL
ncbi:MAG: cation transporting ATPase C-terminal domain-containing protein, partial [Candidatus Thorarchaeota archaeon]